MKKDKTKEDLLRIKKAALDYYKKFLHPKGFQEVEIGTVAGEKAEVKKNKKMDFYIELALLFILGVLIGIAVKTEASKKVTIGFDDYQMKLSKQDFNINQLQFDLIKKAAEEAKNSQDQAAQENADGNVGK